MDISKIITDKLTASLTPEKLELIDQSYQHAGHSSAPSTGNSHFALTIVSAKFIDKGLRERHSMVYQALAGMVGREIHALSIKALTPAEANKDR